LLERVFTAGGRFQRLGHESITRGRAISDKESGGRQISAFPLGASTGLGYAWRGQMREKSSNWLAGVVALIALAALGIWWHLRAPTAAPAPPATVANAPRAATSSPANSTEPTANSKPGLPNQFQTALSQLTGSEDAGAKKKALAELRRSLAGGDPKEAAAAIRKFLDSKQDAPTGEGFKIGAHGMLAEAPTLRTFLLDQLGQIDPAAAADYARVILAGKDSPDEWAVALRNLAAGDLTTDGRALLQQKTAELLGYTPWQQNPSTGYLEAFDAAVYLGGTDLVPALANLARQPDNPAISHAAFLALDRSVINDPDAVLTALLAQPDLLQGRDQTRADYFARADVRDPQQKQLVENYLLSPQTTAAELQQFAGVFPNANYMISQNLLTPTPTPDSTSLAGRDAASLTTVQQWIADPKFAAVRPQLGQINARLGQFVKQEQAR
jgi:hypothetical protein